MKIGIITFWGVPNYGAFLQAYALKRTIKNLVPDAEVVIVPYLNDIHYRMYYKIVPSITIRNLLYPGYYLELYRRYKNRAEKKTLEVSFLHYYEELSGMGRMSVQELREEYFDCIILGSDIIWDYSIKFFGRDRFLFGIGIKAQRKISYAASFGTVKKNDSPPVYVKNALENMDAISVRDKKSAHIIRKIVKREAELVPDPTVLWDFKNDSFFHLDNRWGDYIAVYGSHFSEQLISGAVEYSKKKKCKIICLDSGEDKFPWCDFVIKQTELSPYRWVGILRNADIVMTCTFHGLLFGLIFRKKIVFHMTDFIEPKISDVIQKLDIHEPLYDLKTFTDKVQWDWASDSLAAKMDKYKEVGTSFLQKNIDLGVKSKYPVGFVK